MFDVGPGAFQPRPKVWSAIVRLRPAAGPRFDIGDDGGPADAGDGRILPPRRKTLRNGLKTFLTGETSRTCGIDPQLRPETLAPMQFGLLAAHYSRLHADDARQSA